MPASWMASIYEVEPGLEQKPGWYFFLWGHGGPGGPHATRIEAELALRDKAGELGYQVKQRPVAEIKKENAFLACRLLVAAYEGGERRGSSVDWDDVDAAFVAAKAALGLPPDESD